MNWNKWMRQIHRWFSIILILAIIADGIAVGLKKYSNWMGLSAVLPLAVLLLTGLYLFVLPYAAKWRSGRRARP